MRGRAEVTCAQCRLRLCGPHPTEPCVRLWAPPAPGADRCRPAPSPVRARASALSAAHAAAGGDFPCVHSHTGAAVCLGSFTCALMVTSGCLNDTASSNTGTRTPLGVAAGLWFLAGVCGQHGSVVTAAGSPSLSIHTPPPKLGLLPPLAARVCVLQGARPQGGREPISSPARRCPRAALGLVVLVHFPDF